MTDNRHQVRASLIIDTLKTLPANAIIVLPEPRLGVIIPGADDGAMQIGNIVFSSDDDHAGDKEP